MEIDRSLVSGSMALLVMKLLEDGDTEHGTDWTGSVGVQRRQHCKEF